MRLLVIGSWNKMQVCSIQDTSQNWCPNQTILMIFFSGVRWKFLRWAILGRCWRSWHSGPEILVGGTKVFDEKPWETIDEIFYLCKYCGWDIWYDVPVPVSSLKSVVYCDSNLFIFGFVRFLVCWPLLVVLTIPDFPLPAQTGKWEYEGAGAELIIFRFSYFQLQQPGSAKTTSPFSKLYI